MKRFSWRRLAPCLFFFAALCVIVFRLASLQLGARAEGTDKNTASMAVREVRKTIKADTPLFLGTFKTSVKQLLTDASRINLQQVWNDYDKQKRKWDRYSMLVNSIRMLTPILTMLVTQMVGQNWLVSCIVLLAVMAIAIFAGEKVLEKKTVALATLNAQMQTTYVCPHCHKFLGFVPYSVLSGKKYCPNCGVPIK